MWVTILIVLVSLYILGNIVIYFWQDQFLFKPEKLPADFEFKYPNLNFKEYNLEKEPGININGIHFNLR